VAAVDVVRLPAGALQPQTAIDAAGKIHVIYFKGEAAHGDLFYATAGASDALSQAVQINTQSGGAIATGTMRGGHLSIGRNGRIHVAWAGSDRAKPRAADGGASVMYTRMNDAGTAFEPERSVVASTVALDGGTVASDPSGRVYVAWHAGAPGFKGEGDRRLWVATSTNDGKSFTPEIAASPAAKGACGCCGAGALADRIGTLYLLYRSAAEVVHRDTQMLISRDRGSSFTSETLEEWNVGACPMSTFTLAESPSGILAAWETGGQVQWARIDPRTGTHTRIVKPAGVQTNRKHPAIATNKNGDTLFVWAEGTGWNKGGQVVWQIFDRAGEPIGESVRLPSLPVWGLAAAGVRPNGGFVVVY
jgi:hypothetical protein